MPDQREQKGCHVKQNGGQPGAEWRAIGSKIAGNREQKVGFGKRKARNFGVCALLLFVLLPGHPAEGGQPAGGHPAEGSNPAAFGASPTGWAGMWPTACADCLCRLPVLTAWANLLAGRRAGRGPGAVSRTCTGRRARWLGILPFRVCRRGLRCCGFSPLRGARILSCLSQGT